MNYFELFDDVTVPHRWHLGIISLPDGAEPRLRAGIRLDPILRPVASVTNPGRVLEFSLTSFGVPVATRPLAEELAAIAGPDVQVVPIEIGGQAGMVAVNVLRVIKCVDETESEFIKWTAQDHRADLAGQYRQITRLVLDRAAIPSDAHVFRIEGWLVALIVSQFAKQAMERVGCYGARFLDLGPRSRPAPDSGDER